VSTRFRWTALVLVGLVVALGTATGGSSSPRITKVTLSVVVSGNGGVVSKPAGISCPTACKLKAKKGSRVVLTAKPDAGSQLGSWSSGCGTKTTCTVAMTKSKTVTVSFKTPPPPTTTTTPPPPPPPPAKAGHYAGSYSDGDFFKFDVDSSGTRVGNFDFQDNGHCAGNGLSGNLTGEGGARGPFTIQSDGSFSGTDAYVAGDGSGGTANVNVSVSGKFAQDGTASGNLSVSVAFTSGQYSGINCTSTGTWTAKVQS
jgi:hypothetical protein